MQRNFDPLISIIIPCYNQGEFLQETLDSIISQTYINWECIIVDDGSEDNTAEIALNYQKHDVRFSYFKKTNGGLSAARNYGLKFVNGKYIQFLDSDDLLHKDKFEFQIKMLREFHFSHSIVIVSRHLYFIDNDKSNIDYSKSTNEELFHHFDSPLEYIIESWKFSSGFCVHAWLWPINIVKNAGNFNEDLKINEDTEFYSRALQHTTKLLFCKNSYVLYRQNKNSICNSFLDSRKEMDQLRSVKMTLEILKKYRWNDEIKHIVYILFLNSLYPQNRDNPHYKEEFIKELKILGYDFYLIGRGLVYKLTYKIFGKTIADFVYNLKNKIKL